MFLASLRENPQSEISSIDFTDTEEIASISSKTAEKMAKEAERLMSLFSSKEDKNGEDKISIGHLKNMPKQELSGTIPQEVESEEEQEIPQIEMPKKLRNSDNFK